MKSNVENGSNSLGTSPTLATVLSSLNWGGSPSYASYEGRLDISDPAPAATPDPGAAAAPGTDPAAQPASPAVADSGASPANPGAAQPNANDDNLRQLRQNYEALKPWEKVAQQLKNPDAAVSAWTRTQNMYSEGAKLAAALGYTPESYKAAFEDDPVDVLSTLRKEHATANPQYAQQQAMERAAREAAKREVNPVLQEINKQKTDVAFAKYESEFNRLVVDDKLGFGKDTPEEIKDALYDLVNSLVPDDVIAEIKTQGKFSGLHKVFADARNRVITVVNAYNKMTASRAQGNGNGNGNPNPNPNRRQQQSPVDNGGKPLTLDDIIGNGDLLPGVKAGKY